MTDPRWEHLPDDFFDRPIEEQTAALGQPDVDVDFAVEAMEGTKNMFMEELVSPHDAATVLGAAMGNPNLPFDLLLNTLKEMSELFRSSEWSFHATLFEAFAANPAWVFAELTNEVGSHWIWNNALMFAHRDRIQGLGARKLGFPLLLPHEYEDAARWWREGTRVVIAAIEQVNPSQVGAARDQVDLIFDAESENEVYTAVSNLEQIVNDPTLVAEHVNVQGLRYTIATEVLKVHVPEEKERLILPLFSERVLRFSPWKPEAR